MQSMSSSSPPSILSPPRRRALEMCTTGAPVLRVSRGSPRTTGRMVGSFSPAIHNCGVAMGIGCKAVRGVREEGWQVGGSETFAGAAGGLANV
eukprot:7390511-Prymnesium_polylepis.2